MNPTTKHYNQIASNYSLSQNCSEYYFWSLQVTIAPKWTHIILNWPFLTLIYFPWITLRWLCIIHWTKMKLPQLSNPIRGQLYSKFHDSELKIHLWVKKSKNLRTKSWTISLSSLPKTSLRRTYLPTLLNIAQPKTYPDLAWPSLTWPNLT
jgi:hypothetical protein